MSEPSAADVDALFQKLGREAEASGYHLNPDAEFVRDLLSGLLQNEVRYGYMSCPCRLASGEAAGDRDIVCPCDYRDADVDEFGSCYCALYVSEAVAKREAQPESIPERRPDEDERAARRGRPSKGAPPEGRFSHPVWRCSVCGYLCARDAPPGVCPICKAKKDRFGRFA